MTARFLLWILLASPAFAELPADAAALKAKRDAKVAEIDRAYSAELTKLQRKAMDAGDMRSARDIGKEIESAGGKSAAVADSGDARLKPLVGVWKRDTDSSIWKITDSGNGILNGNEKFTMKFDDKTNRVIVVSEKWANQFEITPNRDVMIGRHEVAGKAMKFKLHRVQ